MTLQKNLTVDINLSAEEIADAFCEMTEQDQALFFNRIGQNVQKWYMAMHSFQIQLSCVSSSKWLNDGGRGIMRAIGEYSAPAESPQAPPYAPPPTTFLGYTVEMIAQYGRGRYDNLKDTFAAEAFQDLVNNFKGDAITVGDIENAYLQVEPF